MDQAIANRQKLLNSLFDDSGVGLEIGPSYNPIVSKASGRKIDTIDYATAQQLREKYREDPNVDVSRIEEVDYVSDGGSIARTIRKVGYYDYILASHVVEHIPDLIAFFQDCETLLKNDGVLVLAAPDKRYCFDVFQTLTATGDLLQAHLEKRTRHTPGKIFDFLAYRALRGGSLTWEATSTDALKLEFTLADAKNMFQTAQSEREYRDIHTWRFTPASFRLIVRDLNEIGTIAFRERECIGTGGFEFFLSLSLDGPGCQLDRQSLMTAIVEEQKQIR